MRKLASVRIIKEIKPIENADNLELAIIDGWQSVVKKGEFKPNDKIIYCEVDSFLPIREEFEFLRKSCYKKIEDREGFRLRTIRLRGEISQGLIIPITLIKDGDSRPIGQDVSNELGVTKYEKPIPPQMEGIVKNTFPSFIQKTDEERIQNLIKYLDDWKTRGFTITEKLDGTSCTVYIKDGNVGVCSRNQELLEDSNNLYWKAALQHDLINKLKKSSFGNIALQGEIIGSGIQSNPYKFPPNKIEFRLFNIFDIDNQTYLTKGFVYSFANLNNIPVVPMLNPINSPDRDINVMLKMAEGKSRINNKVEREGVVWVSDANEKRGRVSFKVISNKYLLKQE